MSQTVLAEVHTPSSTEWADSADAFSRSMDQDATIVNFQWIYPGERGDTYELHTGENTTLTLENTTLTFTYEMTRALARYFSEEIGIAASKSRRSVLRLSPELSDIEIADIEEAEREIEEGKVKTFSDLDEAILWLNSTED
jgi:hypothetical protein